MGCITHQGHIVDNLLQNESGEDSKDQRAMKTANSLNRIECSEYSIIDDYKCKKVEQNVYNLKFNFKVNNNVLL